MDRTRRTRIKSTLSFSFSEIQACTAEIPHLPKGVTCYCWLLEVFWASTPGAQVYGSHGSPTITLIPPAMTNISEASPLVRLHERIRLGHWKCGWKGKPVGRCTIKETSILLRSHRRARLHSSEHRPHIRQTRKSRHFYYFQPLIYFYHSWRNHNGFPRLHQLQAHGLWL